MSNLEVLTADTAERIVEIGPDLAESYKVAFAGDPWNEVSRCNDLACLEGLSGLEVGCECPGCGGALEEAYNVEELVGGWSTLLRQENAFFEVAFEEGQPQRATIARPTNVDELLARKYADTPFMKDWLQQRFPDNFVWIEDTFANRNRKPTGNLKDRGETLGRIAAYYGGAQILTRTLSPAIVAATLRDAKARSMVYVGTKGVGRETVNQVFENPGYSLPTVPDRRTLIVIKNALQIAQ